MNSQMVLLIVLGMVVIGGVVYFATRPVTADYGALPPSTPAASGSEAADITRSVASAVGDIGSAIANAVNRGNRQRDEAARQATGS